MNNQVPSEIELEENFTLIVWVIGILICTCMLASAAAVVLAMLLKG